jgi:hypothetical protein
MKLDRNQMAVLRCLMEFAGPVQPSAIIARIGVAKSGQAHAADPLLEKANPVPEDDFHLDAKQLDQILLDLRKLDAVTEVFEGSWEITGPGRTAIGPVSERPLSEV